MRRSLRPRAVAGLLSLLLSASAVAGADSEQEIEQLLQFVATSGCDFERNGDRHSAPDAADHLRLKYSRGRRYVSSAEAFIDRLASESSWSGKPYRVYCGDTVELSGAWLHRALDNIRAAAP